jgi:hypothetical protein
MQKFNFTLIFIVILVLLTVTSNAQYKLKIGNFWVYSAEYQEWKISVIDTTTFFDSLLYFEVFREVDNSANKSDEIYSQYYIRKKNDNFYEHLTINNSTKDTVISDDVFYKYDATLGDKWIYWIKYYEDSTVVDTSWSEVVDVFEGYQFGEWRTIKKIHYYSNHPQVPLDYYKFFCDDFGEISEGNYLGITSWLKGCYIDGVAYGDTSFIVVGVSDDSFLREFKLSQNYPNPFNPTTIINYSIPKRSNVKIIFYDIKGEEIAVLIDKIHLAGNYTINFDASKFSLSSGVYFYSLISDNFIQTKKMIYLR